MAKITYLGAGGTTFSPRFIADILLRPALAAGTFTLMDRNQERLDVAAAYAKKIAKQLGLEAHIEATTDRRQALDGADYVVSTINEPGGLDVNKIERRISASYGVDQAVGCTTGLGAVFRLQRFAPLMLSICRDMEELCPKAWLFHYCNPTSMVPWLLSVASPIKSVGLCHSVQHTAMELSRYIGVPYEETGHWVAGVNHQAWYLRFEWNGKDAYPLVFEKMQDPAIYRQDIVRFEMMKYFGYFLTESSYHNSEYVPYFRKNAELIDRYTPKIEAEWIDHQEAAKAEVVLKRAATREAAYNDVPVKIEKSDEYCVGIVNAMVTNVPYRFNGNVLNTGLITNLPNGSCVEVPCLVDNMGVHPCYVGDLPPQCAAINRNRIGGDELAVKGTLAMDKKMIEQAVALDPLTAAVCTLDQVHDMVSETFVALADWMPQFQTGKLL
ncbi:MAG: alpha-galactosidase [Anaerolineae bacterium]